MKGSRRRIGVLALAGLGLVASGCARNAPQDTWKPAGWSARTIDNLQEPIFLVAGIVGVLVFVAVLYAVIRFRAKPGDDRLPKQVHGHPTEVLWTIVPALVLAGIAVPTIKTVFTLAEKKSSQLEVTVTGQQWWWSFDYKGMGADGIVTANEMVIPAGVQVNLKITSRDVIHSFWIPKLNGKRDAVPGRVHPLNMAADQPGEYWGQCTEFCGLSHANMRMRVVALSADDFTKWVTNQQKKATDPTDAQALAGQATFLAQCSRCHQVNGLQQSVKNADGSTSKQDVIASPDQNLVSGTAPNLTHLMSRTTFAGGSLNLKIPGCENPTSYTSAYTTGTDIGCLNRPDLSAWLRNAPAVKPMYSKLNKDKLYRGMPNLNLTEQQIGDLVAYLTTLK
jgi:cytochrome c oxidase subunit 2